MLEMHLRQPRFTYSACEPFTKSKNITKSVCFQHDMTYGDFINLPRITGSDKVLRDKAFNIAKNQKYDGYQRKIDSIVYKFFNKKSYGGCVETETMPN